MSLPDTYSKEDGLFPEDNRFPSALLADFSTFVDFPLALLKTLGNTTSPKHTSKGWFNNSSDINITLILR